MRPLVNCADVYNKWSVLCITTAMQLQLITDQSVCCAILHSAFEYTCTKTVIRLFVFVTMVSKTQRARDARRARYEQQKNADSVAASQQVAVCHTEMDEMVVVAESAQFEARDVPGDGDCMFHALSVSLERAGLLIDSSDLRRRLSQFLHDHPFVEDDLSNPR